MGIITYVDEREHTYISFANQIITKYNSNKRASLACAARLADTLCPPGVTLINYKGDNISKYVCPTVIIYIARKITKFINF